MYAWKFLLRECIPVLQFCFKSNAGYLLIPCYSPTLCSFVRLPAEFYVTIFNVAVVSDGSRRYAVGYSLLCSSPGNLISASSSSSAHGSSDLNSPASDALLVAHLPFLQLLRVHLLVLTIRLVLWCGLLSLRGGDFGHQPERNLSKTNSLILRVKYSFASVRCG